MENISCRCSLFEIVGLGHLDLAGFSLSLCAVAVYEDTHTQQNHRAPNPRGLSQLSMALVGPAFIRKMIDLIARDEVIAAAQRIFQAAWLPLRLSSAGLRRKDHELNLDAIVRRDCGHHLYARAIRAEEVCNFRGKVVQALLPRRVPAA